MSVTVIENDLQWRQPITVMPLIQAFPELQNLSALAMEGMSSEFKQYNEKKVVLSEDHHRLFGVFGKKSVIVPHETLVEVMGDIYHKLYGEDGVATVNSMKDGAQVVITMELPLKNPINVGNGDVSNLMLYTTNSYDKGLSLKIQAGVMRLVCTNGAIIGARICGIDARELLDGFNSHTLAAKVNRMVDKAKTVTDVWQEWMQIMINRTTAMSVLGHYLPQKFIEPVLDMEEFPINKYALYNSLTRRSTHDLNTDRARYTVDNIIARIFYGDKLEKTMKQLELERNSELNIIDAEINDTVTETDEITH